MIWSAHLGTLFADRELSQRVFAARDSGFSHVEMRSPFPHERRVAEAIQSCAVQLVCFNLPAGDLEKGDRGFVNQPSRRRDVLDNLHRAVQFASEVGCAQIVTLLGRTDQEEAHDENYLLHFVRELAELVEPAGITLLIENQNAIDTPTYLHTGAEDAAQFVRDIGVRSVRLLLDIYHVARGGGDPVSAIRTVKDVLGHVQIADYPGRGSLGSGTLDVTGVLNELTSVGYDGAVGLEFVPPTANVEDSLVWLPRELRAAPIQTRTRYDKTYGEA
jgi:hydroxypyruvate isomerase